MNDVNLKNWVDNYKSSHQITIDEKISALKILINCTAKEFANSLFSDLFAELSKFPSRDVFRLEITQGVESGREFKVSDASSLEELLRLCSETIDLDANFSVLLNVEKRCIDGYLSVYFIEELDKYFLQRNPLNIVRELSLSFREGIHFVVFSKIEQYGSKTIFFASSNAAPIYIDIRRRLRIISKFKDSSSFLGYEEFASKLLPADFYADGETNLPNIKSFFEKAFLLLSFAFISNQSEIKKIGDNKYCFLAKIHGYKAIEFDVFLYVGEKISLPILYKIYDWAYQSDAGNTVEKIGLVRNLISLHTSEDDRISIDDILWQAIKSNYKVYLQENVEVYLEAKSKIAEVLTSSVEKTQELVEGVVSSIRAAIGVLITFLLTVVLINGFKDIGEALKTFSIPYFIVVVVISVCAWYWVSYSIKDARSRFEYSSENIEKILLNSYKNILLPTEISDATSVVRNNNLTYLDTYTGKYEKFWRRFLYLFCGAYLVGTVIYVNRHEIFGWLKSISSLLFGANIV